MMRIFGLILGLCLGTVCNGGNALAADMQKLTGRAAPTALALPDPDGRQRSLEEFQGQVVVVNFWASWCPPCLREFPSLEQLSRDHEDEAFSVIAVNVAEEPGTVRRFGRLGTAGIHVLMDRDSAEAHAWGVEYFPTSFLLDSSGRLVYRIEGEVDWAGDETVRRLIAQLLAGEEL